MYRKTTSAHNMFLMGNFQWNSASRYPSEELDLPVGIALSIFNKRKVPLLHQNNNFLIKIFTMVGVLCIRKRGEEKYKNFIFS